TPSACGGASRLCRSGALSAVDAEHLLELLELSGVPERFVDADVVLLYERRERLPHRLHAELRLADLHLRVDLVDLLLADEVADRGVRDHDLGGEAAALAVATRDELLRDDALKHERELCAHLCLLVRRE